MLGKLSVPGRPTSLDDSRATAIALAVGAGGGCLDIFFSRLSFLFFLPLSGEGRMVRWSWVNFQCRGVLQFGLQ